MFCPRCGQQQVSETTRYCSRCGFPLEGVAQLLMSGGMLPALQPEGQQLSPRKKGIRQGAMLMLSTILVVPIVAIIAVSFLPYAEVLIPITALVCFVGGLLRILYALLLEETTPQAATTYRAPMNSAEIGQSRASGSALPPASVNPASSWRRPNTAELNPPRSVTENTTRLLERDDPKTR
jgi:hypothetical protein